MTHWIRNIFACLTLALMTTLSGAGEPQTSLPVDPPVSDSLVRSEVRLRKLHLVRPDLIPYPIAYEVCC